MPESKPKFLTKEVVSSAAHTAIRSVNELVFSSAPVKIEIETCCVVVLVPAMGDDRVMEYADWPNHPIQPHSIEYCYNRNVGKAAPELARYQSIAQCKALQLWHGRNDGGTDTQPHLLFRGDTPYWGGVRRDGIAVACSGLEPHFDRMIAGMTADICIALSYQAYVEWAKGNSDRDFLN